MLLPSLGHCLPRQPEQCRYTNVCHLFLRDYGLMPTVLTLPGCGIVLFSLATRLEVVSFKRVNNRVFFAKVFVWPYCYILVVWIACVIVLVSKKCICTVSSAWFVFEEEIILFSFWKISCNMLSNFPCITVIAKISVVCEYQDRDFCPFE